jgi:transposase
MEIVERAWAGIDAGKGHHHVVVIDCDGRRLVSRRVANDEAEISELIDSALSRCDQVTWAIDLADGPAALVIALLLDRRQRLIYLPGIAVNRASSAYRGEGKTDAKDAAVIADQARMRRDLRELRLEDESIAELRMLTAHRADLVADRTRIIDRLRGRLLGVFPALDRAFDFTKQGPLVFISGFQTASAINRDILGAEFLAAIGGSLSGFASADHLAGYAGLAPTPRDSGTRTGNLHRPRRYNRQLQRVFYTSAVISIQRSPASKTFYDRKRAQGKRHSQAVLALARRRVNVLWAMLRDQRTYQEPPSLLPLAA